ncbi:MAG: sigma factor G inhibitor Gin [Desulfotomaculaceae bacterium]|nr:sigma factor G inhibitor Gin [Desulfotomaculaceae bacterium]
MQCILCQCDMVNDEQALLVKGHHICTSCEARIVRLHTDAPEYDHYKNGLKKVWWCAKA